MKNFMSKRAWVLLLMAVVITGHVHARSRSSDAGSSSAAAKETKTAPQKAAHVGKIRFLSGSEETAKDRSSRLKRECKGGVNAGACAGYTR